MNTNDRSSSILETLISEIKNLYSENKGKLLFHGWHHIEFVRKKSLEFAMKINADSFLVETAALTHDLNYIIRPDSEPEEAEEYRKTILLKCGYIDEDILKVEKIITESHTKNRGSIISKEGMCLSDADSLFKVLPITPVVFAGNYIRQNGVDLEKMANKITEEQNILLNSGIYFYTDYAKEKYLSWAEQNLKLWNNIGLCLKDEDINEVLKNAKEFGAI